MLSLLASLVVVLVGVWIFVAQTQVREAEAVLAAKTLAWLMGTTAEPLSDGVFRFGAGFEARGLKITGECSIGPIVGGVLVATGLLTAMRGRLASSFFVAGAAAIAVVGTANLIRLGLIAWSFRTWGYAGYQVTHTYVGSVLIIFASGAAIMIYLSLAGFRRSKKGEHPGRRRGRQAAVTG
ncbi:hypothetical protein B7486_69255 [cyanobacterium TDX16]|nr:hypothetical protein B7486_69255 [cyanobacterium TDX16]